MDWAKTPLFRFVAAVIASMLLVVGLFWAIRLSGHRVSNTILLPTMLLWAVVVSVVIARYWRRIDEAAREAQKSAWLWGGSFSMAFTALALSLNPFGVVDAIVPADAGRHALLMHGALIMVLGQVAGFLLAWAWWWWRRR